ncbi:MAG: hypothetical protein ABII75_02005 [Candidatus Omnitrophota bacterium]
MKKIKEILKKIYILVGKKRFSTSEKIVLSFLAIIVVFALNFFLTKWSVSQKKQYPIASLIIPPLEDAAPKTTVPVSALKTLPLPEPAKIRDPFLPSKNTELVLTDKIKAKPELNLKISGILMDKDVPSAIINSRIVKIGDVISGKTVVDIEKETVILMEDGDLYVLELRKK